MSRAALGAARSDDGARCGEEGASPVTSIVGLAVFLTFLLVIVQVVVYLFTASVVQAAAVDGASRGAGAAAMASEVTARGHAEAVLGDLAGHAVVTTGVHSDQSGQVLTVDIEVRIPTVLGAIGLATVERGAEVRIER